MIRLTHVETLLLLCTTHWARNYLRAHGVYEVVRALHEDEEVEKVRSSDRHFADLLDHLVHMQVAEHVERLVNLLKRDEGKDTVYDGEDVLASSAQEPESDDEDSKIEEL